MSLEWIDGNRPDDEADYQAWLRDGSASIMHLAEIDYAATPFGEPSNTLRLSTATIDGYHPVIKSMPSFVRRFGDSFAEMATVSLGSLTIDNSTGLRDDWAKLNVDLQRVAIKQGAAGWDADRFRILCVGMVQQVEQVTELEIALRLRAPEYLDDKAIQASVVAAGTNKGLPMPIMLGGICYNVAPVLTDAATLTYKFHDSALYGPANSVIDVRDSGISFNTDRLEVSVTDVATDTLSTATAHGLVEDDRVVFKFGYTPAPLVTNTDYFVIAAGLTATDFRLSETKGGAAINLTGVHTVPSYFYGYHWTADAANGTITLSVSPAGQLTLDANGALAADGIAVAEIVETVLSSIPVRPYERYREPLGVADAGVYIAERTNAFELANKVAAGTYLWIAADRSGFLRYGKLNASSTTYSHEITEADFRSTLSATQVLGRTVNYRVLYKKNNTKQTSLAGAVTDSDRAYYSGDGLYEYSNDSPTENYILIESPFVALFTASAFADELAAYGAKFKAVFQFTLGKIATEFELGDFLKVTHPRYGFNAGKVCRIVGLDDRPETGETIVSILAVYDNYAPGPI